MIVVPAGITSLSERETRDLNKGGFSSPFSRKYASTCGVFKSFLLIHTKEMKRCKYDSASCRACVV